MTQRTETNLKMNWKNWNKATEHSNWETCN